MWHIHLFNNFKSTFVNFKLFSVPVWESKEDRTPITLNKPKQKYIGLLCEYQNMCTKCIENILL